jgi:transcriptional regulator with XRE-family HTH domain
MTALKIIRKAKGLSVPALSGLADVPVRTIENIERRGDCLASTARKLADALGVTLDELCRAETTGPVE